MQLRILSAYFRGMFQSRRVTLASIVAGAFLLSACTSGAPASSALPVNPEPAPDFEIELFGNVNYTKGDVVNLDSFAGQPLVLNFWFPSCPPCRIEMPDLQQTFEAHQDDGLEFIGVQLLGLDSIAEGQEFIDDFGITYAVGPDADGSLIINYDVIGFPTTVFVDRDHNVVRKWTGPLNREKLEDLVAELLP